MTQHLWDALENVRDPRYRDLVMELARLRMSPEDARARCLASALLLVFLCQVSIGFNLLYDFRVSSSRYERAA